MQCGVKIASRLVPWGTSHNIVSRFLSSGNSKLITVIINEKTKIATLALNRPPVNGLNLELLKDIHQGIENIESGKYRGLILTSASNGVFSAGLDITEIYKPDQERLKLFWTTLQDIWLSLYGSSVPTAAIINGHSPAGGCLLAMSCEYRIMLPTYTIGLNETQLGIVAPKWFMSTFCNVLPRRIAEMALMQGKMFTSEEALKTGLVDELVDNSEDALTRCEQYFTTFDRVNTFARAMTKHQFRAKELQQLENERQQDLDAFLFFVNQHSVQKGLGMYLENLKKKSNKSFN